MSASQPRAISGSRLRRWLRWLFEALLLILLLYLFHLWQTRDAVQGVAPPLEGRMLDGSHYSLQDRPRGPLLVYFWASWCPVCGLTSGNVDALAETHPVITVAMQSGDSPELMAHLEKKALRFPVLSDPQGEIAHAWGVRGVPTLYFLDDRNRIRQVTVGYTSSPGLWMRLWLSD